MTLTPLKCEVLRCIQSYQDGYSARLPGSDTRRDCYNMGLAARRVDDAREFIRTYGRGRIVADQRLGAWIQIDHDRAHSAALEAAASFLESQGLAERHPTKGNPRNVRFIDKHWAKP